MEYFAILLKIPSAEKERIGQHIREFRREIEKTGEMKIFDIPEPEYNLIKDMVGNV